MSPGEVLDLPLRMFWMLAKNITRIRAEEDQRTMSVLGAAQSPEGYEALTKSLNEQIGDVVIFDDEDIDHVLRRADAEYDQEGLLALKALV